MKLPHRSEGSVNTETGACPFRRLEFVCGFILFFVLILSSVARFISISATKDVVAIHKAALGRDVDGETKENQTRFSQLLLETLRSSKWRHKGYNMSFGQVNIKRVFLYFWIYSCGQTNSSVFKNVKVYKLLFPHIWNTAQYFLNQNTSGKFTVSATTLQKWRKMDFGQCVHLSWKT